ncbi:DcaP family trimeric outer membrane transporter [Chryseobacterium sp. CBSDS_008]|uniref:DcaP family trimeric outer membrane transporter n=1 Tax=Chryseobacterium sp. CBSDS_008 TaxID=3415265 RepID=UPI003CEEC789
MKKIQRSILLLMMSIIATKGRAQIVLTKTQNADNEFEVSLRPLLQANYGITFQNMNATDGFVPQAIEVPQRDNMGGYFSLKQSSIGLEIKNKNVERKKSFSSYLEIDFYGKDGATAPRFKHGFIRWNGFTIGQTASNFSDTEIYPNIFDFNGPSGLLYSRRIQISYYTAVSKKGILSFSLEDPNTPSIALPSDSLGWKKRAILPSFSAMYRYGDKNSYIKAGTVLLPISYGMKQNNEDRFKTRTIAGWGGMMSGKLRSDEKNIFSFESSFGKGISTYNADLNGEKYDAVPNPGHQNLLETLSLFNIVGMYEHWWDGQWSSVAYASYSKVGAKDYVLEDMTKSLYHMSLNLIFQPYKKFRIGVEANYGVKQTFDNRKAHAWKIQTSASLQL